MASNPAVVIRGSNVALAWRVYVESDKFGEILCVQSYKYTLRGRYNQAKAFSDAMDFAGNLASILELDPPEVV